MKNKEGGEILVGAEYARYLQDNPPEEKTLKTSRAGKAKGKGDVRGKHRQVTDATNKELVNLINHQMRERRRG